MSEKIDYDKLSGILLFWHFPDIWWRKKHWLARLMLSTIFVCFVSAMAIAMYDARMKKEYERLDRIEREQIGELSKIIAELKGEREEVKVEEETRVMEALTKLKDDLTELKNSSLVSENASFTASMEEAIAALEQSAEASQAGSLF